MPSYIGNREVTSEEYEAHQRREIAKHELLMYGPEGKAASLRGTWASAILERGSDFGLTELSVLESHIVDQICAAGLKAVRWTWDENGQAVKSLVDPRWLLSKATPDELREAQQKVDKHLRQFAAA